MFFRVTPAFRNRVSWNLGDLKECARMRCASTRHSLACSSVGATETVSVVVFICLYPCHLRLIELYSCVGPARYTGVSKKTTLGCLQSCCGAFLLASSCLFRFGVARVHAGRISEKTPKFRIFPKLVSLRSTCVVVRPSLAEAAPSMAETSPKLAKKVHGTGRNELDRSDDIARTVRKDMWQLVSATKLGSASNESGMFSVKFGAGSARLGLDSTKHGWTLTPGCAHQYLCVCVCGGGSAFPSLRSQRRSQFPHWQFGSCLHTAPRPRGPIGEGAFDRVGTPPLGA